MFFAGTPYKPACFSALSRWPLTSAVTFASFEVLVAGIKWSIEMRPRPTMQYPIRRPSCAGAIREIAVAMADIRMASRRVTFIRNSPCHQTISHSVRSSLVSRSHPHSKKNGFDEPNGAPHSRSQWERKNETEHDCEVGNRSRNAAKKRIRGSNLPETAE